MRELWAINLSYEDLNGAFTPAREYYENNNIKLRDREGGELDARTSLGDANECYKELKQRFKNAKEKLKIAENLIDGEWEI